MYPRLLILPNPLSQSLFLFGARGTGKTSWLRATYPKALYFDLLNDDIYRAFSAQPTRLSQEIPSHYQGIVIIDEIQKIPSLLNEVHRLIEGRKLIFILTGSSARTLRRRGVNLLAGRALTYHMHPLTTIELGKDFTLQRTLEFGQLPTITHTTTPKEYLQSYITTYLREEILQEGITRNLGLFSRFMEVASFSQGEVLNYTEIAREVSVTRYTVANYFDILEDLLIGYRLPVFTKRAKRDMIKHPKFYYFDTGIFRQIRPQGPLDTIAEGDGAALETLFLQEARALNDYLKWDYKFYYWRTPSRLEVDFILYGPKGFHAVEIKRKQAVNQADFKGLQQFKKDYPEARCYLLYGGNREYYENDIRVTPYEIGLKNLKELF